MDPKQVFTAYEHTSSMDRVHSVRFCPNCGGAMMPALHEEAHRPRCVECGYVFFLNPAPGVAVLIVKDGKFLLCRRSESSFRGGLWCLPGGHVEFEEDYLSAARREVKEETGLVVEIDGVLSVVSNFLSPLIHSLVVILLAHPIGGAAHGGDDIEIVEWYSPDDPLPDLAFEGDGHIIGRYFSKPFSGAPVDPRFAK